MHVAACQKCGAGLPLPDHLGLATCERCHAVHSATALSSIPSSSDALASSPAGDAARIPMTDDAVLALLRQHLAGIDSMYLCPNITGKKELAARSVHARHLPSHERVLALFDDTVFGSGDDGFLVTAQRVCWKNVADRAHMIEWQHVDPDRMFADRRRLVLGTGAIEISDDESITLACEEAFHVLAFSARVHAPIARSGVVLAGETRESKRPTLRPSRPAPLESTIVESIDSDSAITPRMGIRSAR